MYNTKCAVLICLTFIFVLGCSSIRHDMVIPNISLNGKQYNSSIKVYVEGGVARISAKNFKKAIENSLREYKLFKQVIETSGYNYLLEVTINIVDQPGMGFNMEVYFTTTWKLIDAETKKLVWQDIISTTAKKTVGDAFLAIKRLRLANEEAVKTNIKRGIIELSRLNL